ncbi:uncharacterized protein V2V93DRAFT_361835 [Kockiozyma suomiensis]|uniref:uncharacterized protein n=1 Tax=Kockiozyma suomiensis TaxID=1337062 RepID=UPI003344344E
MLKLLVLLITILACATNISTERNVNSQNTDDKTVLTYLHRCLSRSGGRYNYTVEGNHLCFMPYEIRNIRGVGPLVYHTNGSDYFAWRCINFFSKAFDLSFQSSAYIDESVLSSREFVLDTVDHLSQIGLRRWDIQRSLCQ